MKELLDSSPEEHDLMRLQKEDGATASPLSH
jgi:hypothetical protein